MNVVGSIIIFLICSVSIAGAAGSTVVHSVGGWAALAGLVGITAGCANVTPASAVIIGALAGVIVVFSVLFFMDLSCCPGRCV